MSHSPLVSIIVTSYNYARFLREAIDSALNQTYPHTEVIVVDDGSSDESPSIISSYGERIVPLLKEHEGPIPGINAAFALSRGRVIIFLDSDDILLPTAVGEALGLFDKPDVVKVHWPLWEIDKNGKKTGRMIPNEPLSDGNFKDTLIRSGPDSCNSSPSSGNALSRTLLERVLPIELKPVFHADTYFTTIAAAMGTIRAISEPQGCYRVHGGNEFARHTSDRRNRMNLDAYSYNCLALSECLMEMGIEVDPEVWKRGNANYTWMQWQDMASEEIKALVPLEETYILVDEENWGDRWGGSEIIEGLHSIPFLERNGQYWGPPPDDETAITEFERLRQAGASFIVFAWPAFWWLDYYSGLRDHLRSNFRCVLENERVVVFDVRNGF